MKECDGCGDEINPKRVKAMPKAKNCIYCQEQNERDGKFAHHKMSIHGTTRCGEIDTVEMILHRGAIV